MIQLHLEPHYAAGFEPLIREFSSTRVIIDHLGRPFQGTAEEHALVVRWSRFTNTVMNLSSLPDRRQYPHRDIGSSLIRFLGIARFHTDKVAGETSQRASYVSIRVPSPTAPRRCGLRMRSR
jgi:predicted TIM-barrel fold metal-dependent hydrolase